MGTFLSPAARPGPCGAGVQGKLGKGGPPLFTWDAQEAGEKSGPFPVSLPPHPGQLLASLSTKPAVLEFSCKPAVASQAHTPERLWKGDSGTEKCTHRTLGTFALRARV